MSTFEPVVDTPTPLVSVLVYNYNYGKFLQECLQSIIAQTYPNIEIIFSDNASTDNSWDIATAFAEKHPGQITIVRNRENVGAGENISNCMMLMRGRYYIMLCSDDILMPEYIESCVKVFKHEPDIGFVMVHHTYIDDKGQCTEQAPFYNQSCVINGEEQAAVYMMAAVNPSVSQIMYDRAKARSRFGQTPTVSTRWYGARIKDFELCMQYPIAYIKTPLLKYRQHGNNDSLAADRNLLEVIGPYLLIQQFSAKADVLGMHKVTERLPAGIEKLATLSLRYSVRHLINNDEKTAKRYFHLAAALTETIVSSEVFKLLSRYWNRDTNTKKDILRELVDVENLVVRSHSYEPPRNSRTIEFLN